LNAQRWQVAGYDSTATSVLMQELGVHSLTAKLLSSRGFNTPEQARAFIDRDSIPLYDPFLLKDMDKAVARINTAIANKESVCIYGDYDVDGVTSTTLLYTYLSQKGCKCSYFIPDRISEGYGLSAPVIERLSQDTDLIITVDTGITALDEAAYAKSLGVDMIITDHHSCRQTLPEAVAVINPHREDDTYPFKHLAGVGVVFKLLCALDGGYKNICDRYAEVVAIGTIADVMPLIDENRYIAYTGLARLADTKYLGLTALMRHAGIIRGGKPKKILSSTVGYVLAPRINAAGRIASASRAVELLLSDNEEDADRIAAELCDINKMRQATEQEIYNQAIEMIQHEKEQGKGRKFYVLCSDGWHQGVIGVVASRIAERYGVPCVLFSFDGDIGKGSGRSVKGFSLMDALSSCEDVLLEFGGHELAAGLSITRDNVEAFTERINQYASEHPADDAGNNTLAIDCEAAFDEINIDTISEIQLLEPFGLQNPLPVFVMRGLYISEVASLSAGKHTKLRLRQSGVFDKQNDITAIYFGMPTDDFHFYKGDICDVAFSLDINEYMGVCTPQLLVKSVSYSGNMLEIMREGEEQYAKLIDPSDSSDMPRSALPTLSDFRSVFRFLRRELLPGSKRFTDISLYRMMTAKEDDAPSYCALKVIIDVLADEGLATVTPAKEDAFDIELCSGGKKVDLDTTRILSDIKKRHDFI